MEQTESENVDRGRIVYDYKHTIIQSVEHDNHGPSTWTCQEARDSRVLREQYSERGRQLDENEAVMKSEYDNNHCEDVTGLSSDGYRHQVIEDYTHEQMAGNQAAANQSNDYWNDSAKDVSAENQNMVQCEQADYWANSSVTSEATNEQENSLSKDASC